MTEIDWFKFEDRDYDFPFYKKNPHISKMGWLVLFFVFIIGSILSMSDKLSYSILCCIVFIVPVLYFLDWDYKAIFRKPSLKDIALAVALFIGYLIYAIIMGAILESVGIVSSGIIDPGSIDWTVLIKSVFSLMGEEFIKFLPFIFFLRVLYKYTDNRKLSVVISVALVMAMFASLHAYNWVMFIYALFIQGFGSIFEFFAYIKTKNIIVSYITHYCTDAFIFAMLLLGLG
ncbi:hypothetical protein mru_0745 [Methanobrevibacter ruminantium M1]|uniref:CAAX prenyl protease 2/Lysostaphin resistance protein A-like domain-containing protein n=1 Tax=Methanobrevibacter ruminantium (strain ATCC 35063 / DSM 1093 / JCM 13430 / OCM 146 / M1) TaxID=634498 RepID=D3E235_METRM|nr:CPBP family intramembrane metalloprotease [Methanobrevibacter ruminantium]ADC46596.1 hypothetical protein mru_0745 [Methanobrevibacter ruminantium M1]